MMRNISFDVTDKEFLDLVALEVRGELDGNTSAALRADDRVEDLHRGLVCLKRNVETQLSNKKSRTIKESYRLTHEESSSQEDIDLLQKDYADWRAKAVRFLGAIELEISETKAKINSINDNANYIDELVGLISEQMNELNEEDYTEADQRVFEVANRIKNSR